MHTHTHIIYEEQKTPPSKKSKKKKEMEEKLSKLFSVVR